MVDEQREEVRKKDQMIAAMEEWLSDQVRRENTIKADAEAAQVATLEAKDQVIASLEEWHGFYRC